LRSREPAGTMRWVADGLRQVALGCLPSGFRIIFRIGVRGIGRIDRPQGIVHKLFGRFIIDKPIGRRCLLRLASHLGLLGSWMPKMLVTSESRKLKPHPIRNHGRRYLPLLRNRLPSWDHADRGAADRQDSNISISTATRRACTPPPRIKPRKGLTSP